MNGVEDLELRPSWVSVIGCKARDERVSLQEETHREETEAEGEAEAGSICMSPGPAWST